MRKTLFPHRRLSLDEYLAIEEASLVKHEFVAGEVYAMSGVTLRHNLITLNIVRCLHGPARARRCSVLATDVKLRVMDRIFLRFRPDWMRQAGNQVALAFECESPADLDQVYARVVAAGFDGEKEPWDAFWGQRYAQLQDPDGVPVDLYAAL